MLPDSQVAGFDVDETVLHAAHDLGATTRLCLSAAEVCDEAEVVILAVPRPAIAEVLGAIRDSVHPGAVITDTVGTKRDIVGLCEDAFGSRYVGGHPMAGSVDRGPGSATATLFRGAPWILTPTPNASPDAVACIETVVRTLEAMPVCMSPDEHDRLVAYVSQLPHVLAYAVMRTARHAMGNSALEAAGGSFRDATRVAHSDPSMWADLLTANADFAIEAIDHLLSFVMRVRQAITDRDGASLQAALREGCHPSRSSNR